MENQPEVKSRLDGTDEEAKTFTRELAVELERRGRLDLLPECRRRGVLIDGHAGLLVYVPVHERRPENAILQPWNESREVALHLVAALDAMLAPTSGEQELSRRAEILLEEERVARRRLEAHQARLAATNLGPTPEQRRVAEAFDALPATVRASLSAASQHPVGSDARRRHEELAEALADQDPNATTRASWRRYHELTAQR